MLLVILGNGLEHSLPGILHHLQDHGAAQQGQTFKKTSSRLLLIQSVCLRHQDVSRIDSLVHLLDGHPALPVSLDDGPLDRRRPPKFGKQGRMDVQAAIFRYLQDFLR